MASPSQRAEWDVIGSWFALPERRADSAGMRPESRTRRAGVRFLVILGLSIPLTLFTLKYHGLSRIGIDDANIFFVYVEHLSPSRRGSASVTATQR